MLKNKKGFTLMETLVVVLIIGILAAIAFPNYEATMERTRVATNLTLFKSMANAAMQYYTFNDEWPDSLNKLPVGVPEGWTNDGLSATSPTTTTGTCTISLEDSSMQMTCGRGGDDYKFQANYTISDTTGAISIGDTIFSIVTSDEDTSKLLTKAAKSFGWQASGSGYKI